MEDKEARWRGSACRPREREAGGENTMPETTAGLLSALAVCVNNLPAKLPVKEWLCGLDVEGHERLGWEE